MKHYGQELDFCQGLSSAELNRVARGRRCEGIHTAQLGFYEKEKSGLGDYGRIISPHER